MFNTIRPTGLFLAALLLASGISASAEEHAQHAPATQPAATQPATQPAIQPATQPATEEAAETSPAIEGYTPAPYPLTTCVVSGDRLDAMGDPYVIEVEGREVQLCCKGCEEKVRADPATYFEKIDQAVIDQQMASYPLGTCLIHPEKALSDGAVDVVWENRLVRFSRPVHLADFYADPATHIKTLNQAVIDQQKASYPLDTCVVSGEKLASMDEPVDHVVGHRLVRLCCEGCVKDLSADPAKYLSILDGAQSEDVDTIIDAPAQSHHEDTDASDHHGNDDH